MASVPFFKPPSNQVRTFPTTSDKIHGFSKAQMCLKKIIDIISSRGISKGSSLNPQFDGLKPNNETAFGEKAVSLFPCKRGFDIDLNLRLGLLPLETEGSENPIESRGFSACSAVGGLSSVVSDDVSMMIEKSSEGECDPKEVGNSSDEFPITKENEEIEAVEEEEEEETREFSEITNLQVVVACEETEVVEQSETKASENKEEQEKERGEEKRFVWSEKSKNDGYLGLLVEAARLISGNFEEEEESEPKKTSEDGGTGVRDEEALGEEAETETKEEVSCRSKRNRCWMLDFYDEGGFEDISPVVRSKRGRNQVLPCRYRDSVLEPWKRLTRQRSTRVSTKRKPK